MSYNKLVIGLTGGIGSGKTTVANFFADHGINIIDTDLIARQVTEPVQEGFQQIVEHFGSTILTPDNKLNRSALGRIIFANEQERRWLESLLHPLIREEMARQIMLSTSPYCIAVIPLLFETSPNSLINRILVVDAPESLQIERTVLRDQISKENISDILKAQALRETRLQGADDIIYNDKDLKHLEQQVDILNNYYLSLTSS